MGKEQIRSMASTSRAPSLPTEFGANRLLAAKRARKKAEDDHQLLQNRLHRLQVEEQRAASKIEETRKRAEEILALKARNVKARADKEASMRQSEEEVLNAQQRACEQRETRAMRVQAATSNVARKKREDVLTTRKERQEHELAIQKDREAQLAAAAQSKATIKAHEQQVQMASHKSRMMKTEKFAEEFDKKVKEEEALRLSTEEEREMERHEAELIERLKSTQTSQRNAYEHLEEVLNLESEEIMKLKTNVDTCEQDEE